MAQHLIRVTSGDNAELHVRVEARTLSQLVYAKREIEQHARTMSASELVDFLDDECVGLRVEEVRAA